MISVHRKLLTSDGPGVHVEAANARIIWEGETIALLPNCDFSAACLRRWALRPRVCRLENHFFVHDRWMEDDHPNLT